MHRYLKQSWLKWIKLRLSFIIYISLSLKWISEYRWLLEQPLSISITEIGHLNSKLYKGNGHIQTRSDLKIR